MNNRGDYIHTYTGKKFYLLDPQPEDICIEDIAHALSNLCRFGGHSPHFYSVAQHSIAVSYNLLFNEDIVASLLHDASEAYLCDIPRPFKAYLHNYKELENKVQKAIFDKFGIKYPYSDHIHYVDKNIVAVEANELWGEILDWTADFDLSIEFPFAILYRPKEAEKEFLNHWYRGRLK